MAVPWLPRRNGSRNPSWFNVVLDLREERSVASFQMQTESTQTRSKRVHQIIAGLQKTYPDAHCELHYSNPVELLVATILSAQCTDKQVNIVTKDLFAKYRTVADYANADPAELQNEVRRLGFFRNKAKNIRACCCKLIEQHGGEVPRTFEEMVQLDGVGRKTANVVLGNAFNINLGVAVDTHVARLAQRLGLTDEKTPEKIEEVLVKLVPQDQWTMFSHWLIWHGRRRCSARKPDCLNCEIQELCPSRTKV